MIEKQKILSDEMNVNRVRCFCYRQDNQAALAREPFFKNPPDLLYSGIRKEPSFINSLWYS